MLYENNTAYVILEYVEGVSLKKFLQSNTGFLSWEQVKKLFVPVFTTLSIIHNAGIIHRGLSPENIIVTINGELKLTGFCISSIRTSNTGLSPEFYSGYAAPEQYSSLDWQGTWTDVYAISAVLYRILTGTVPLDALTRINNDTMPEPARVNPQVPPRVSKVLMRGLAVRGEERIQTITELVTALFEQPEYVGRGRHGRRLLCFGCSSVVRATFPQPYRTNNQRQDQQLAQSFLVVQECFLDIF